eukprot:TRINITY_DN6031_c0_g2_i1.p1 TRINITY_DN6031_c0_g2~~TRINITY_DN6031_c0_g2_i1.p1  ORF type:complete len:288 (+),score=92.25 TRINITY_DN6031_c0_g2_i1:122-985(+)
MGLLDDIKELFDVECLYQVLHVEKKCSASDLKKAYFRAARKWHPDKACDATREAATTRFQALSRVHALLSDEEKRKLYDECGLVDDDDDANLNDDLNWESYWRNLYPKLTEHDLDEFAETYRHSAEEEEDLKQAYLKNKGNMDAVFDSVPLSNPIEDEDRFRKTIQDWIAGNEVKLFKAFRDETDEKREKRRRTAEREAKEAKKMQKANRKNSNGGDLYAMIAKRNARRSNGFEDFAAKYGVTVDQSAEPSEEEFQAIQAKLSRSSSSKRKSEKKSKKSKKAKAAKP